MSRSWNSVGSKAIVCPSVATASPARAAVSSTPAKKAMATALATIGKFVIKKKASSDSDAIFGAVTAAEVVAAVEQQTGRVLDKRAVTLPEIKSVGTFDATVKLHPEVVGAFKVVVQREKNA